MTMKAIGYADAGPISAEDALIEFDMDMPQPGPNDLLVEVRGISVNPVDVKVRANAQPDGAPRILGFDAAGIVKELALKPPGSGLATRCSTRETSPALAPMLRFTLSITAGHSTKR